MEKSINFIHHILLRYYEHEITKKNMFSKLFERNEIVVVRVVANYVS